MSTLRPIGDFGKLFAKLDLDTYLARDPAAALIQDVKTSSFQLAADGSQGTVEFLLATGRQTKEDSQPKIDQVQRELAYMVAILRGRNKPADARMLIGASAECDIFIPEESVSREHAWVFRQDGGYYIEDYRSTNGSWVGGERADEAEIANQGEFTLGSTTLMLIITGGPAAG